MKFKKITKDFLEKNEIEFKSWYEKYINSAERDFNSDKITEDEAMEDIFKALYKGGVRLSDSQKRDLKSDLF